MKTRLPILLLLSALIFISCTGELSAANKKPIDCVSITNFYPRAPDDVTYYAFSNPIELFYDYMPYFRGFIPPGTAIIDLLILENGKQMAVARHKIPPTGLPLFPPTGYTPESGFTLSKLEEKDQWATEQESYLYVAIDSIPPPRRLDIPRAGWLYVKVGGGSYSPVYTTSFSVRVDTKIYNAWWDKYIGNAANWKALIEDVETYVDPTSTHVLLVTPPIQTVSKDAGTTTFGVSNTGTNTVIDVPGKMPWAATVTSGGAWLSIKSGSGGSNSGTITCAFTANTGTAARTGTIQVVREKTDEETTDSPVSVTVTQTTTLTPTPTPTPIPTPTPTPTPAMPAKPTADPPGGTEFSISPAQVKVTSTSATQIYYTFTSSTDGNQPDEPSIPIPSFPVQFKGKPINGSGYSGTLDLPYIFGEQTTYTIYRVKFQGENASGAGEVSDVLQYTVNKPAVHQTIKQADAKQNPGVDYTYLIKKQDGSIDPLKKFLIPAQPATLSEYSAEDMVLEYLRTALPNISIELRPCKSGTVLVVKDASWGGTIVPLIVEKISSNADADNIKVGSSGNIEILYRNILIVLNMAGAYEDQLAQMVVDIQGMRLDYGSGHIVVISSDSDGFSEYKLAYRYQFGAKNPSPLSSGDSYTAGLSADDSIQVAGAVPIKITYDDGTTQYLIPGVIDADAFIKMMEDKTEINPNTGEVTTTDKNGTKWYGLPEYYFYKLATYRARYEIADDKIVFYSTTGYQTIKKK